MAATVRACETVDGCVKELLEVVDSLNGRWIVTSDHGNADDMVQRDKKGKPLLGERGLGGGFDTVDRIWGRQQRERVGGHEICLRLTMFLPVSEAGSGCCNQRQPQPFTSVGPNDARAPAHAHTGEDGKPLPLTSHTLAPVPFFIGGKGLPDGVVLRDDLPDAGLANVAATTFNLLGFEAPGIYKPSMVKA